MEKKIPLADVGQTSSPIREIQLSDAQKAFQEIVESHEDCKCVHKKVLTKEIQLIAEEIVKSKIRDKLLLTSRSSKTDLDQKFAQMEINNDQQKEKRDGELLKLKSQVVAQQNSISNQAKYFNTLMEKVKNFSDEIETLKSKNLNLSDEIETFKSKNLELTEKNDELLAQINGMLQ